MDLQRLVCVCVTSVVVLRWFLLGKSRTKIFLSSATSRANWAIVSTRLEKHCPPTKHFSHMRTICRRPVMMKMLMTTAVRRGPRNPRRQRIPSKSQTKWWKGGKRPYRSDQQLVSSEWWPRPLKRPWPPPRVKGPASVVTRWPTVQVQHRCRRQNL